MHEKEEDIFYEKESYGTGSYISYGCLPGCMRRRKFYSDYSRSGCRGSGSGYLRKFRMSFFICERETDEPPPAAWDGEPER